MESISAKELFSSKDPSLLVVDIRDEHHFRHGHIKGSINIDIYNNIWHGNHELARKKLSALPKDKKLVIVCNVGATAKIASSFLESMGYKAMVLEGGIIEWHNQHLQVHSGK
ncbi:MAG: rhodanese-like domain-containing protein [Nanoarchaeota archaeon]